MESALLDNIHLFLDPDQLNAWEEEEIIEKIAALPASQQMTVLELIPAIWPVSHSLCLGFLAHVKAGLSCLSPDQLKDWVRATLSVYESDGLLKANQFMAEVETNYVCRIRGDTGLRFEEARGRLLPYLRGISGRSMELSAGPEVWTDGRTIYLPAEISQYREQGDNFFLYKLITTCQWGLIHHGTFDIVLAPDDPRITSLCARYKRSWGRSRSFLENYFSLFPEPDLVRDLFQAAELIRITALLTMDFPGLMREAASIEGPAASFDVPPAHRPDLVAWLRSFAGPGRPAVKDSAEDSLLAPYLGMVKSGNASALDALDIATNLYHLAPPLPGPYLSSPPPLHHGHLRPDLYEEGRLQRRAELKEHFTKAVGALIPEAAATPAKKLPETARQDQAGNHGQQEEGLSLLMQPASSQKTGNMPPQQPASVLVINDAEIEIPVFLQQLIQEIRREFREIPADFIASASGLAGSGAAGSLPVPESAETAPLSGPLVYDEWDYRRGGVRKNWCKLLHKELLPVKGSFVEATLTKHRRLLLQLKKKFEMLRTQDHLARRQRDGDDIDLDAFVDSLADLKADRTPSDQLFLRLIRDQRNIATIFLVDMSSSTEGWVGTAIKESLVLMCEAMEVLGDRYGIYGFSGMRRTRSELYHIKELQESYGEEVKGRIAAISPKDYTRMGPPIRHASELLSATEAKVRLLITISDGKPEDYDDYKGEYAIEDTRHALMEAKHRGVHPFCITIDRKAHDYIAHMYGEVNYIFINDVAKLPARMPEIYRALTT